MSRDKKPSHIPIFPDAYLRDTTHLTTEEHGAYFLLLMAAWGTSDCTLPNDERRLAGLARMSVAKWRKIAPNVLEFWTIDKGRISQKRLLKEWVYVKAKRAKAAESVRARWAGKNEYERITDVDTNVIHQGGGGGGGVGEYQHQGFSSEGSSNTQAREAGPPFKVIGGGR